MMAGQHPGFLSPTKFTACQACLYVRFPDAEINYIHNNPVSGKWNLADDYTAYAHSSAAFYDLGQPHELVAITDYREYWF